MKCSIMMSVLRRRTEASASFNRGKERRGHRQCLE
jgi:hypothetical protein